MSVNRPTNTKEKEQDIERKLRLYGIYQAFSIGKVPNNKQIDIALNSAINHKVLAEPSEKLSEEGRKLLQDLRHVLEQAKVLLLSKNHDQKIQEFIWHTQQVVGVSAPTPNTPVSKDQVTDDGNRALAGLRTLGTLIITNGQFRKLLSDSTILLKDMASDAASNAADRIRPSDEQLQQMDQPAEDHTWHGAPTKDSLKQQLKESYNKNKLFGRGEAQDAAQAATQTAHPGGSDDPRDLANKAAHEQRTGQHQGIDAVGGTKAGAQQLREQASNGIPQEHKDRVYRARDRTSSYFKNKMPKERRDQVIFRLKKMVVEIQSHKDYQQAIDTLLYLAETYTGHGKNLANQATGTVQSAREDNHLRSAEICFRIILERFANNTSSQDLFDSINDIYKDADQDPALKDWFRAVDSYIRRCLKEQGYILTDHANDEYDRLYDEGKDRLRSRYREHTDRVIDEFKFLGDQFAFDPQSVEFGNSLQKLFEDLGNDPLTGKPAFKKHLIKDLTGVILPGIFESVRYIPVPRIEYSDPTIDVIVENLVVESDNLMPNTLEVANDSYFRFGRKAITNKNKQQFMISVSGVQCDLKDVSYYVNKKQGFPSLKDTGIMDVYLGGDGFSFKLKVSSAEDDKKADTAHYFKVDKVDVSIKHMKLKLRKSNHKTLFGLFKPILMRVMRPAIQKVLEKQIKGVFNDLDSKFFAIQQEAEKAEDDFKRNPDPENAKNIYSRYYTAAQKELTLRREHAKEFTKDKKANLAMTKEDSIFKDIALPGGVSTKATEYKKLAREGDNWESPVFAIGSAKESTNIPPPAKVTRKSHDTKRASLRDTRSSQQTGAHIPDSYDEIAGGRFSSSNAYDIAAGRYSGTSPAPAPYDSANNDVQYANNLAANVRGTLTENLSG